MKKTAVEWMIEKINYELNRINPNLSLSKNIIDQAKAMEKEQISEAYRTGVEEDVYNNPLRTGEQYYNETYKSEE